LVLKAKKHQTSKKPSFISPGINLNASQCACPLLPSKAGTVFAFAAQLGKAAKSHFDFL